MIAAPKFTLGPATSLPVQVPLDNFPHMLHNNLWRAILPWHKHCTNYKLFYHRSQAWNRYMVRMECSGVCGSYSTGQYLCYLSVS